MPAFRAATADRNRRVLECMQPGVSYEAREVASAMGMSASAARSVLDRLRRGGSVERVEPVQRGLAVGWMRPR